MVELDLPTMSINASRVLPHRADVELPVQATSTQISDHFHRESGRSQVVIEQNGDSQRKSQMMLE